MPRTTLSRREFLNFSGRIIGGLAFAGVLGVGYTRIELKWVEYSQVNLQLSHLPPAFDGFRIVHLTDTHFDEVITPQYFETIVEEVNSLEPDLIAFTGDLIDQNTPNGFDPLISAALNKLHAKEMVCAIPGNHDHWEGIERFNRILADSQIEVLDNKVTTIEREGQTLHIAGVDSVYVGATNLGAVNNLLPENAGAILLAHEPDLADQSKLFGKFALQLSGHSHGGLVELPFFGAPVLPRHGQIYPEGLYHVDGMYVYTSRGIGTGKFHIRFACRPEVAVITLNSV